MLKKILTGATVALTLGGAALATATPAAAQYRGGYHGYYGGHRGYGGGAVLGAGILGLAVGAAIAGDHHRYYAAPPPAYYYGPTYYSYYGGCHSEWRWDRYYGRYVPVERCY
jgi:hypothetical protein